MLVSDNAFAFAVNAPADGSPCAGNEACRAVCASICTHAEMAALLQALVRPRLRPEHPIMGRMHMVHVAVDEHGQPRSKPTPSCITCSRDMLRAGVTAVWLWGAPDASLPSQWRGWSMADFHGETLKNCGLVRTP